MPTFKSVKTLEKYIESNIRKGGFSQYGINANVVDSEAEKILKEQGKTKSWLCDKMDISFYNLNKAIKGGKKSISYKYLEGFCKALNCSFNELLTIVDDESNN